MSGGLKLKGGAPIETSERGRQFPRSRLLELNPAEYPIVDRPESLHNPRFRCPTSRSPTTPISRPSSHRSNTRSRSTTQPSVPFRTPTGIITVSYTHLTLPTSD